MSIADKIVRLTNSRDDIRTAITAKGVLSTDAGFEDFSGLITAIPTRKVQYVSDIFTGTKPELGPYILDFEPKAFMIKCNETDQSIYDNMVLSDKTNTVALYSGFCTDANFAPDFSSALPQMIWVAKTAVSTALAYTFRNLGAMMKKTYVPETGKWSVAFSQADSPSYAYRFVLTGALGYQIMFIGG